MYSIRIIGRAEGVPVLFISLFGKGSARGEPFYSVRARVKWAISFHEALSANPVLSVRPTRPTDENDGRTKTTDDFVHLESVLN